ncbi:RICIN domain-containing protein [Streptomyces sp. NPDC023998]|uniref:RICIN domain-containing protein n=1 Tax=Streptomyces sp. NPDC023998 TaxID=3154597 RepID=UPI00340529D0
MIPTAADDDPLVLSAFRTLSPASQQALCPELAEVSGPSGPLPAEQPGRDAAFVPSARTQLCEAYLRAYTAQAPSRTCRHLTAVMDDTVQGSVSDQSSVLDRHTAACRSCSGIRADLAILRSGSHAALTGLLLDAAENQITPRTGTADAGPEGPRPAAPDMAAAAGPGFPSPGLHPRSRGVRVLQSRAAVVVAASVIVLAAVVAVSTMTDGPSSTTRPPQDRVTLTPSISAPAATTEPPAPVVITSAPAKRSPASSRSPDDPPVGSQLVNRRTGLCVGAQSRAAGAWLRLEECRTTELQRWETVKDASGAYQLRNSGSSKCLDGTDGGGNVVRAVLSDCGDHSSPHYTVQLWTISPVADSGAFRLQFVPPVASSDYSLHLLGPEDWPNESPPRKGSYLAHLPDYYNSESFVFTMNHDD